MKGRAQIIRRSPSQRSADRRVREKTTARAELAVRSPLGISELLLLADGRVLVHNLTPAMAEVLAELNPDDPQLAPRALSLTEHATRNNTHELPV